VTLGEELRRQDRLEQAGGLVYLTGLQEAAPTAAAVGHYAKIVRGHSIARTQIVAAQSFASMLYGQREEEDEGLHRAALIAALELSTLDGLETVGMDELLAKEIEVEWLVEPLIPLNGVTGIIGDSRLGKSWVALSVCHALANRFETWLGKYRIQHRNGAALYLDNELGEAGMRARLLQLDLGCGVSTDRIEEAEERPLRFLFDAKIHTGQIGALEGLVREHHVRLIVLDPWADFIPPWTKLTSNDDMYREIQRLRRFAARLHCAIVFVHHRRKFQVGMDPGDHASSVLGAQAIVSRPDSTLMLLGRPDGPRTLVHDKARLAETVEPAFYLEKSGGPDGRGAILLHGGMVREAASEKTELAEEVALTCLRQGQMRQFELLKAMSSQAKCGGRTAREVLLGLCAEERIRRIALEGRQVAYELPNA